MAKNKSGGGCQTNINGLAFEQETSLKDAILSIRGYDVSNKGEIYYKDKYIGQSVPKYAIYKRVLEPAKIDYSKIISKRLLPDEALYVPSNKIIYIIEKKFQEQAGSVDEKLQTCDFKKRQYTKLFNPLGISVEYIYVLSSWFKQDSYRDVLEYIVEKGCSYYFNELPLSVLGLPHDSECT